MRSNLETMRGEIRDYLESRNIAVFHGSPRGMDDSASILWDTERHPDYRAFISAAETAGVRLITLHANEFSEEVIDDAIDRLEESTLPRDERRSAEQRLKELRGYSGFICQIELSFDLGARTYIFELRTDWYDDLNELLYRIDEAFEEDDESDALGGGYFSKN
jgi:hypothetical protein